MHLSCVFVAVLAQFRRSLGLLHCCCRSGTVSSQLGVEHLPFVENNNDQMCVRTLLGKDRERRGASGLKNMSGGKERT